MSEQVITINGLAKTYRSGIFRKEEVRALRDVSFAVERGSIFGLLGPNGAGKTTLIKILLGLVRKSSGDATLLGHPAGHLKSRLRVGYLPEHHRIPRHHTANSALTYYGGLSGMTPAAVKAKREGILTRVGLGKWAKSPIRKFSKGMLQRLGLAQALLHDPELLILDEPTDGVDPVGRSKMRTLLRELQKEGKTIFINSHLLQEVELVCDQVAILVQGQLQRFGDVSEIKQRQQPDMEFHVSGAEAMVRAAFQGVELLKFAEHEHHCRALVKSPTQPQINQCIDQLRAKQLDIRSLAPLHSSLEDAFMSIVSSVEGAEKPDDLEFL